MRKMVHGEVRGGWIAEKMVEVNRGEERIMGKGEVLEHGEGGWRT